MVKPRLNEPPVASAIVRRTVELIPSQVRTVERVAEAVGKGDQELTKATGLARRRTTWTEEAETVPTVDSTTIAEERGTRESVVAEIAERTPAELKEIR